MSEHDFEPFNEEGIEAPSESEATDGLQDSQLDSVTGGGDGPEPIMDLQTAEPDRVDKSDDGGTSDTKNVQRSDPDADVSNRDGEY